MHGRLALAAGLLLVFAFAVFLIASDRGMTVASPGPVTSVPIQEGLPPDRPSASPEPAQEMQANAERSERAPAATIELPETAGILLHVVGGDVAPIASARVRTFEDSTSAELVTNEQGECRLPVGPEHGVFKLEVDAEGFSGFSGTCNSGDVVWVQMFRCAVLVGKVLDADTRNPVEGARVKIYSDEHWLRRPEDALVGATGAFRIEFTPLLDDLHIVVQAEGYPHQSFFRNLLGQDDLVEMELLLEEGIELSVLVVDHPTGVPIEGARVGSGLTGADGRATVKVLPFGWDGRIHLEVSAVAFCTLSCSLNREELPEGSPLVLPLVRPARFEGILLGEEGDPVAGVHISFNEERLSQPAGGGESNELLPVLPDGWVYSTDAGESSETNSDGRFVSPPFVPLEPRVRVTVDHLGAEVRTVAGPLGGPETRSWLDLRLTRPLTGTIEGRLLLNGEPCKGRVTWWKEERHGASKPDPSGNYRLEKVSVGEIEIHARLDEERFGHAGDFLPEMRASVWVESDRATRHDFDLALPFARIGGKVTGEDALPQEGVLVHVKGPDWRFTSWNETDATGRWEVEVPDIGWEFQASVWNGEENPKAEGIRAGDLGIDFVLSTLGTLPLRILDAQSRKPVDTWDLAWRRQGERAFRIATVRGGGASRPDGSVVLRISPGAIDLLVGAAALGYRPVRLDGVVVSDVEGGEPLDVLLQRGFDLAIELDSMIEPPPYDQVRIVLLEPETWESVRGGLELDEQSTLNYNDFLFDGGLLYPGWTLRHRMVDFVSQRRTVLRGLSPGVWRFKAFPADVEIEPEYVTVPHEGPLMLRWRRR